MRSLRGLRARLFALLARALARRFLAWLSSALILLSLGTAAAAALRLGSAAQLGLALAAFSALPAFLLWPAPEGLLERSLRRFDEGSVFEAYLDAPPGPARELLGAMAAARSEALAYRPREKAPRSRRLAILLAAAAICLASVEGGALLVRKRPLLIYSGPEEPRGADRAEEGSFSPGTEALGGETSEDEGREDEEAKRLGEEEAAEGETDSGRAEGVARSRRRPAEDEGFALPEIEGGDAARSPDIGGTQRDAAEIAAAGEESGETAAVAPDRPGGGREKGPRNAGRRGRGFESSADTGIPSPIVDYRARFSRVYAERTGKRFAASGKLGLEELGALERRFFGSFSLSVDIVPGEDPYEALLKRRWRELRGGLE